MNNLKLLLCGSLIAAAICSPIGAVASTIDQSKQHITHPKHHKACGEHARIHHDNYLMLLAEKYTPQDQENWTQALQTKQTLFQQFKALRQHEGFKALKEQWKKDKKHQTFFTNEQREAHQALHAKFTEAVKAKDENQLKAILPQLLAEQLEMNKLFEAKIAKWQEALK